MKDLFSTGLGSVGWPSILLALTAATLLGKVVAVTYHRTYVGFSTSRSFTQALVLGSLVAAVLIMAIGDNLARGLGILGTMALVRFRTNIADSRDMIFIFAALAVGVAAGAQSYAVAILGALFFSIVAHLLHWEPMRRSQRYDGTLRFGLTGGADAVRRVESALAENCIRSVLTAMRELGDGESLEYVYQVKLKEEGAKDSLFRALNSIDGLDGISLFLEGAHARL